ncbi:hypothetical protein [Oceanithermus sp.]|nr:hypothetical protein [Oceanithermus sp.]
MDPYHPAYRVGGERYPELNRRLTSSEYREALAYARRLGLWRFAR